eukprot:m.43016 g.43016  ORF g.43016 m.43016 type:complete len:86 (-) comp14629_c1_seq1:272-529(-)
MSGSVFLNVRWTSSPSTPVRPPRDRLFVADPDAEDPVDRRFSGCDLRAGSLPFDFDILFVYFCFRLLSLSIRVNSLVPKVGGGGG